MADLARCPTDAMTLTRQASGPAVGRYVDSVPSGRSGGFKAF